MFDGGEVVFESHIVIFRHYFPVPGAQITHSWHGEVVTKNNNTGLKHNFVFD